MPSKTSPQPSPRVSPQLSKDPYRAFHDWFRAAADAGLPQPDAVCLATASARGRPSARMVLHKGVRDGEFFFYTNYESRKSRELLENPYAALVFFWAPLQRQIRVEGKVRKATAEQSDAYFRTRPRESCIGAWASRQSRALASREELEERIERLTDRFSDVDPIPRPANWGGFRLQPSRIEFWEGRDHRLHDRLLYERGRGKAGSWKITRLSP